MIKIRLFNASSYKLISKLFLSVSLGMVYSSLTHADRSIENVSSENAFNIDAEQYAKEYKTLYSEALKRLAIQNSTDEILKKINEKYEDRLAGIYYEHEPSFKLVIYLTGNTPVPSENITIKNRTSIPLNSNLTLSVVYKTGAKFTKKQLIETLKANGNKIKQAYPDIQSASVNEIDNTIDIERYTPLSKSLSPKRLLLNTEKPVELSNIPITIKNVNIPLKTSAAVRASETMLMADGATSTSFYNCTSGFNIKNAAGTKFSTTAAHCKNFKITLDDRKTTGNDQIPLTFVRDYWNGSQDFQIMSLGSTTHTINPEFFASDNVVKTLTGRRTRTNTKVGDYVCHYGMKTGYSCGTVQSTSFKAYGSDDKCGPNNNAVCNATWVKVSGPSLDCWGGDSGGPIFIGNVAAGLLSTATYSGTWSSTMKGKGYCGGTANPNGYMAYMSTDELYTEGYSLLYGQ